MNDGCNIKVCRTNLAHNKHHLSLLKVVRTTDNLHIWLMDTILGNSVNWPTAA